MRRYLLILTAIVAIILFLRGTGQESYEETLSKEIARTAKEVELYKSATKHKSNSAHVYNYDVEQKFDEMCGYWKDQVELWKQNMRKHITKGMSLNLNPLTSASGAAGVTKDPNNLVPIMKAIEKDYGTGDRISGLVTAIDHAIKQGKRIQVIWKNIDAPFTMSDKLRSLMGPEFDLDPAIITFKGAREASPCKSKRQGLSCKQERHKTCPEYYRACLTDEACKDIKNSTRERITMAHTVGCPLRLLWSPTAELMNFPVSWYLNGNVYNGTLFDMESVLEDYRLVTVHVRLGDAHFDGGNGNVGWRTKRIILEIKKCAQKVEDYMREFAETSDDRIRWLIASDDPTLRAFFREKFPNRTVTLMHNPALLMRMDRMNKQVERIELLNMFAEWYMVGRGDELITNYAHPVFGESSFSRSAWLYNLKSEFFLLKSKDHSKFCERGEFLYHGNVHMISKSCQCVNPLNRNCPNAKK